LILPHLLREDDQLVALDKPSGLPVTAAKPGESSLLGWGRERFGEGLAAAHRLDTAASGVVLCARTKEALDFLSGQFQSKTARRVLVAMVVADGGDGGEPPPPGSREGAALAREFSVDLPLGPDRLVPGKTRVQRRGGRSALTHFRVLEVFGRFAWLECRPLTGVAHQVRAHLAAAGAPVLNDPVYGDSRVQLLLSDFKRGYKGREEERSLIGRLALHASSVGFVHPGSRQPATVEAPLPRDFEVALRTLRKFARPGRR
jgi:RluA family pseudouridine synthase